MRLRIISGVLVLCAVGSRPGAADPCQPAAHYSVSYRIHETPSDPESPVAYSVTLRLHRTAATCAAVGWTVEEVEIRAYDGEGVPEYLWQGTAPRVDTPDGRWWVTHADVSEPEPREFLVPPSISGTAAAVFPNDTDLVYALEGGVYVAPPAPEEPPYELTAALTYSFRLADEPEPIQEGSEEPTDTDPCGGD